ncbi:MAG: ribosome maturation factor RimP [Ruminococcaceae bacterium]|nr:ribosome maturation factor RimP [Oscillospiraceae bacterium]
MAANKKPNTVERVCEIAAPLAKERGLHIWDIRYQKEGSDWYLRVFIDKEGGVGIEDCVEMSHALDKPLDEGDFIPHAYILEVSSPGVERELTKPQHFEKMLGQPVSVKTIRPIDGQREFAGVLTAFEDGEITITQADDSILVVNKKDTAFVRLDDFGGIE